jgi:carboxymethylenebutenolidase
MDLPTSHSLSPALTRPEGCEPEDFHLTRRGLAGLLTAGYAAYAFSAEADPIVTDAEGLIVDTVSIGPDKLPAYLARPAAGGRYGTVIVVSEVFGVHEHIRDLCRRFAKLGYVAIAPAFFFRADPDATLTKTMDFAVITKIVGTAKNEQVMGDVGATLDWLNDQPFVDKKRVAITGFCWGGAVVWMACARFPEIKAGAAWYGRLSHPAPTAFMGDDPRKWPLDIAPDLTAPVLGLYGGKDQGIPLTDIEAMRAALKAAGKTGSQLIVYPEAEHGFNADYRSSYNAAAAKDGWARMLAHFAANHAAPGKAHGFFG